MYTPMSRACAAKLVTKSRVGGEPAMAARTVPPWAGHLSGAAPDAPDAVRIDSKRLVVTSLRTMVSPVLSVAQQPTDARGDDLFLPVVEPHGIERQTALAHAPLIEVDRRHAVAQTPRHLGRLRDRGEDELAERQPPRRLARDAGGLRAGEAGQRGGEAPAAIRPLLLVVGLLGGERLERGHGPGDLLLADLEAATEAVARHPVQRFLHELLRRRPRCRRHVHVHLLEEGGGDEVAAAAEKPARLRPAER